jgi:hypothetical protein
VWKNIIRQILERHYVDGAVMPTELVDRLRNWAAAAFHADEIHS